MTNDKLTGLALIVAILVGLFAPAPVHAKELKTKQRIICHYTGCKKSLRP
jgi:hypothetical protein